MQCAEVAGCYGIPIANHDSSQVAADGLAFRQRTDGTLSWHLHAPSLSQDASSRASDDLVVTNALPQ